MGKILHIWRAREKFCDLKLQTAQNFNHTKVRGNFMCIKRKKFQPYQSGKKNILRFEVAFAEKNPPYQREGKIQAYQRRQNSLI